MRRPLGGGLSPVLPGAEAERGRDRTVGPGQLHRDARHLGRPALRPEAPTGTPARRAVSGTVLLEILDGVIPPLSLRRSPGTREGSGQDPDGGVLARDFARGDQRGSDVCPPTCRFVTSDSTEAGEPAQSETVPNAAGSSSAFSIASSIKRADLARRC